MIIGIIISFFFVVVVFFFFSLWNKYHEPHMNMNKYIRHIQAACVAYRFMAAFIHQWQKKYYKIWRCVQLCSGLLLLTQLYDIEMKRRWSEKKGEKYHDKIE